MSEKKMLAIDLGASSGRGIIGRFDGKKITLEEIHRFSNDPLKINGSFYWDTLRLLFEIKAAILKCAQNDGVDFMGIDTWGVDYGYIDKSGNLLSLPYHYRDSRTLPEMDRVYSLIPYEDYYKITGIESMSFNTCFQMSSDVNTRPWVVENAETALLTPDLLGYFLTGKKVCEYTMATTTALMNGRERKFSKELLDKIGIPEDIFAPIVMPGSILGKLTPETEEETGNTGVTVINVPSHDTSCAVLAVPATEKDFLFISCGTWSLMGTENECPIINEKSEKFGFTNEGGVDGKINIMKNIMGLWLLQESRRQWMREGVEYSFNDLDDMADKAEPFKYIIDPNNEVFNNAGNLPERIREFCEATGQGRPETVGEIVRCIYESLVLKYRLTADSLEELTGKTYNQINIVGGGIQGKLLCRYTADCTGKTVSAGPVEATAIGNIAMQLIASGDIADVMSARAVIRESFDVKTFAPDCAEKAKWDAVYDRFKALVK